MPPDAWAPWLFLVRAGLNASALLGLGLALHAAIGIVEPTRRRRVLAISAAAALTAVAFCAARLVAVTAQLGDGLGAVLDGDMLSFAWTALGASTLAIAGGALAIIGAAWSGVSVLAAVGAIAMAASFGLTGHTQALTPPGLAPPGVTFHVLLAGFWIAAPLTLWPRAGLTDEDLHARLRRFSHIAIAAVPVLLVVGMWLALLLTGSIEGLTGTAYGQLLLAKLAASLAALGLGAYNNRMVTQSVLEDAPRGRRLLSRTLSIEATLFAIAVLAISAATTFTGPVE